MSYSRREVKDHVTIMNKDLYDNLQDGIDESKQNILEVHEEAQTAMAIAKGRNRAHIFSTTQAMKDWLSDEANVGVYNKGDNIYIIDVNVPDWWIADVLSKVDPETGYFYKIAQLETQKVDLTDINEAIKAIEADTKELQDNLATEDGYTFRIGKNERGELGYIVTDEAGADTVIPFSSTKKLYEALKYSGLVTEDMSFDEICAMFAKKYPQRIYYYSKTQEYDVTWDTEPGSFYQRTYVAGTGGNNLVINSTSAIDVTDYNKLILRNVTVNWNNKYNGYTYVIIRGGTTQGSTGLFSTEIIRAPYGTPSATVDTVEIDVSNIYGELYLSFFLSVYTGSSGNYAESTCSIDDIYVTNE